MEHTTIVITTVAIMVNNGKQRVCFCQSKHRNALTSDLLICYQEDIMVIFGKADKNQSGALTVADFKDVIDDICERYPQVEIYLKKKQLRNFVDLLKNYQGNAQKEIIDIKLFKSALSEVDTQMKNLPPTAQVNLP